MNNIAISFTFVFLILQCLFLDYRLSKIENKKETKNE